MSFKKEKIQNYYLHDTPVENVFINEYMIDARGEYVKVYLFALMYSDSSMDMTNEMIARQLTMPEEEVLSAWTYWEKKGVIRKHFPDTADRLHYHVEFLDLKARIYGKNGKGKEKTKEKKVPDKLAGLMDDKELRALYSKIEQITGRLFEGKEPATILSFLSDYGFSADAIAYAYEYCVKYRNNSKQNYVSAVLKEWAEKGLLSVDAISAHLSETDNRHYRYKRVLKALGFLRNATEEEQRIMDTWFDELGVDIETVLTACKKTSGISNPNINYINTVLNAWKTEGKGGKSARSPENPISLVVKSYEEDRVKSETEAEARREEVYKRIPRIKEIEDEMRKLGLEISRIMLAGGTEAKSRSKELRSKSDRLSQEKAYLLTENNYQLNYMDIWYYCSSCKDTGILDTGERCKCFSDRLASGKKDLKNKPETVIMEKR